MNVPQSQVFTPNYGETDPAQLAVSNGVIPGGDSMSQIQPIDPSTFQIGLPSSVTDAVDNSSSSNTLGGDISSFLGGIESGLTGGGIPSLASIGSSLGTAIPYAGVYGAAQAAASAQQSANQKTVQPLLDLGSSLTTAGGSKLADYKSGTISPAEQDVSNTAQAQGQVLIDSASPLAGIAQQAFNNYNAGTLTSSDQATLDNYVKQQKSQAATQLAAQGITDSSVLDSQFQQIDNNAVSLRQQMLQQYFSTGDTAYNQWATTTEQGQNLILQGKQYVVSSIQQNLTDALALDSAGMTPLSDAISQIIQSDTQIQNTMTQLMGSLASAWAYQTAKTSGAYGANGAGGSGSGAGGSGGGVNPGQLAGAAGKAAGNLLPGGDTSALTGDIAGTIGGFTDQLGQTDPLAGAEADFNTAASEGQAGLDANYLDFLESSGGAGGAADYAGTEIADFSAGSTAAAATDASSAAAAADTLPEAIVSAPAIGASAVAGGELTGLSAAGTDAAVQAGYDASGIDSAVSGASAGGSALGTAIPIVGAAVGAYGTYEGIEAGNPVTAGLSGAETGAAVGSFAGPVGTVVGGVVGALVGIGGALIKGTHTQEGIAQVGANQQVIKLQSGNSALQQGGIAFGAGSSRSQGSAQWFLVPQSSMQLGNGPSVTQNTPFYIGNQASTMLTNYANSVPLDSSGKPDFSSYLQQYQANPNAGTGLVGVYNNNGGQAAWGQSFSDWIQSIWAVKHNVTGNLNT